MRNSKEELTRLVQGAQDGDVEAFEKVVKSTEDYARKLAYPIVGPDHCEDVLQESYLLAFRKLGQLKKPEVFLSWFCRLVLHAAYRHKKKNPHVNALPEDQAGEEMTEPLLSSMVLRKALDRLKPKEKELLVLRELLQLSYDEIAHVLQLPVGTVRSRLHKSRKRLEDELGALGL